MQLINNTVSNPFGSKNCFFSIVEKYNFEDARQFKFLIKINCRQSVMQTRAYSSGAYRPNVEYVAIFSKKNAYNSLSGGFNCHHEAQRSRLNAKKLAKQKQICEKLKDAELGDCYAFEPTEGSSRMPLKINIKNHEQYRIHDARLGRFLSVDSLSNDYPWNSCYSFAENDVIGCVDLEGREKLVLSDGFSINGPFSLQYINNIKTINNYLAEKAAFKLQNINESKWALAIVLNYYEHFDYFNDLFGFNEIIKKSLTFNWEPSLKNFFVTHSDATDAEDIVKWTILGGPVAYTASTQTDNINYSRISIFLLHEYIHILQHEKQQMGGDELKNKREFLAYAFTIFPNSEGVRKAVLLDDAKKWANKVISEDFLSDENCRKELIEQIKIYYKNLTVDQQKEFKFIMEKVEKLEKDPNYKPEDQVTPSNNSPQPQPANE